MKSVAKIMTTFNTSSDFAKQLDSQDLLASYREQFVITDPDLIYLDGNSLADASEIVVSPSSVGAAGVGLGGMIFVVNGVSGLEEQRWSPASSWVRRATRPTTSALVTSSAASQATPTTRAASHNRELRG